MSEELRIVLVGAAKAALDRELTELQKDERISINASKLGNWIILDYCERYIEARRKQLAKAHFNERKCFEAAMRIADPEERRCALREAAKSLGGTANPKPKKTREVASEIDAEKQK